MVAVHCTQTTNDHSEQLHSFHFVTLHMGACSSLRLVHRPPRRSRLKHFRAENIIVSSPTQNHGYRASLYSLLHQNLTLIDGFSFWIVNIDLSPSTSQASSDYRRHFCVTSPSKLVETDVDSLLYRFRCQLSLAKSGLATKGFPRLFRTHPKC